MLETGSGGNDNLREAVRWTASMAIRRPARRRPAWGGREGRGEGV